MQSLPSGCREDHISTKRQAAQSRAQEAWWSPPRRGTQARAHGPTERGHHPWTSALWQIPGRNAPGPKENGTLGGSERQSAGTPVLPESAPATPPRRQEGKEDKQKGGTGEMQGWRNV